MPSALSAVWLALLGACSSGIPPAGDSDCDRGLPAGSPPDVLVVLVDTLRADHLPAWGYERDTAPAFSAWAEEQLIFEDAVSQAGWTVPAVSALFTGLYPPAIGDLRGSISGGYTLLAERFQQAGYATAALTKATVYSESLGYGQGFDHFEYVQGEHASETSGQELTDAALALLSQETCDRSRPLFLFVHYLDPHLDYAAPEPWYARFDLGDSQVSGETATIEGFQRGEATPTPADIDRIQALYDGEIAYWDSEFERLLAGADALLEAPVLAVLGDHGEQFMEHGSWAHEDLWQENLRVPFVLSWPGVSPRRIPERVRSADLLPTLAGLLDWAPDPLWQTRDLSGVVRDGEPPPSAEVYSVYNERSALIDAEGWKLIRDRDSDRLFDLETDPGEQRDRAAEEPARLETLRARAQTIEAECAAIAATID